MLLDASHPGDSARPTHHDMDVGSAVGSSLNTADMSAVAGHQAELDYKLYSSASKKRRLLRHCLV